MRCRNLSKTMIALAAVLTIGVSAEALAGGVVRCSLVGVNTVRHGSIFGKRHPDVAKAYGFIKLSDDGGKHGTWGLDPDVCGHT